MRCHVGIKKKSVLRLAQIPTRVKFSIDAQKLTCPLLRLTVAFSASILPSDTRRVMLSGRKASAFANSDTMITEDHLNSIVQLSSWCKTQITVARVRLSSNGCMMSMLWMIKMLMMVIVMMMTLACKGKTSLLHKDSANSYALRNRASCLSCCMAWCFSLQPTHTNE